MYALTRHPHDGRGVLQGEEGARDVEVDGAAKGVHVGEDERPEVLGPSRARHRHVQGAQGLGRRGHGRLHLLLVGDIAHAPAQRRAVGGRSEARLGASADGDRGTVGSQPTRRRQADAAPAAGDERAVALERVHDLVSFIRIRSNPVAVEPAMRLASEAAAMRLPQMRRRS